MGYVISPPINRAHKFIFLLCLAVLFLTDGVCVAQEGATVRVGIFQNVPLSFTDEQGVAQGIYPDVIREIARLEKWELEFVDDSWSGNLERLKRAQIDLMVSIVYSAERDKLYDFSKEPVVTAWGQVYAAQDSKILSILDLEGKKVAIMEKDINAKHFRELCAKFNVTCSFIPTRIYHEVSELIANKKVDAGVINNINGEFLKRRFDIHSTPIIFSPVNAVFAAPEAMHTDLLNTIDSYLNQWRGDRSSIYYRIMNTWFGDIKGEAPFPIKTVVITILVAVGVSVFLLIWLNLLRHQVKVRTSELLESEKKYKSLANNLNVGIYRNTVGPKGRFLECNPAIAQMFGFESREDFLKINVADLYLNPDDRKTYNAKLLKAGALQNEELQLQRKDGTAFFGSVSSVVVKDSQGNVKYFDGVIEDITDRKQADIELLKERDFITTLIKESPLFVVAISLDRTIKIMNPVMANTLGYRDDEVLGTEYMPKFIPEDEHEAVSAIFNELMAGKTTLSENHVLAKDGRRLLVEWHGAPVFNETSELDYFIGIGIDITNRKQIEERLMLFRKFAEASRQGMGWSTLDGRIVYANPALYNILKDDGIFESPGRSIFSYYDDATNKMLEQEILPAVLGQGIWEGELTITNAEGHEIPTLNHLFLIHDAEGKPLYFGNVVTDISERKRADKRLMEARDKAQMYLDLASVIFVALNEKGEVTLINRKGCEILGYEEAEIVGKNWFKNFLPPKIAPEVEEVFHQMLSGEIESTEYYDNPVITKQGDERLIAWHNVILRNADGKVVTSLSSGQDITERKQVQKDKQRLEAQLQQVQKMESIGTLAGGIAHDFNNILSLIIGYTEIALSDELPEGAAAKSSLEEVHKAGLRARDLVKQILAFSRQSEAEKKPVNLISILRETMKLLRAAIPTNIKFNENIDFKEAMIFADPTQIHQIIMNICTNAAFAMREKGGVLGFDLLEAIVAEDEFTESAVLEPGTYFKLSISDTGHGMDQKTMERIFDPFFTTKPLEEGTGMGMAVVHGIVKDHGGHISIDSELDQGAVFDIFLPKLLSQESPIISESDTIYTGTERILVVDDEPGIVTSSVKILQKLGYQVEGVTSSSQALETFQMNPDAFDLLITDQMMPEMTGDSLAREFKSIRADLPIILCTGFSHQITEEHASSMGISKLLMKPILRHQLAQSVRQALNQDSGNSGDKDHG